jgi:hypothetical protein
MAESLEIFNQCSRQVNKHRDGTNLCVSICQTYVDPCKDVMEKQNVTNELLDQSTVPESVNDNGAPVVGTSDCISQCRWL